MGFMGERVFIGIGSQCFVLRFTWRERDQEKYKARHNQLLIFSVLWCTRRRVLFIFDAWR